MARTLADARKGKNDDFHTRLLKNSAQRANLWLNRSLIGEK